MSAPSKPKAQECCDRLRKCYGVIIFIFLDDEALDLAVAFKGNYVVCMLNQ